MIKKDNIYICYIAWGTGGKKRPALILSDEDGSGERLVFGITTKYEGKSGKVRASRLPIQDWQEAGLDKPSYIHLEMIALAEANIGTVPIGKLSKRDAKAVQSIIGG